MLPKKKNLQEIANEETTAEFLQEVVEPEVHIPEEPEVLMEEEEIDVTLEEEEKPRVIIEAGRTSE
jgi:hypothetical protein